MRTFFLRRNEENGEIRVDPKLQNSHLNQQRKFFFCSASESERREGARVYIKHYCQLIQAANYLCHFIIV